jgi:hypothetical protein
MLAMSARRTGPQRRDDDSDGRNQDRRDLQHRQMIAEKDETENRGLDRLGLEIGRGHHKGAIIHRCQHEPRGKYLAQRAE